DVDFVVHPVRRTPGVRTELVFPVFLAGVSVEAVNVAVVISGVAQAVVDGAGTHGAAEQVVAWVIFRRLAAVVPDQAGILVDRRLGVEVILYRREVLVLVLRLLGDVDAPQVSDAFFMFGVLADADVQLVLPDHRRRNEVTARGTGAQLVLRAL